MHRMLAAFAVAWIAWLPSSDPGIVFTPSAVAGPPEVAPATAGDAVGDRWQRQLRQDLGYLADDALRGRDSVEDSIHQAADYLVERFREIGLRTDVVDGGPLQDVRVPVGARIDDEGENRLTIIWPATPPETATPPEAGTTDAAGDASDEFVATLGQDYVPLAVGAPEGTFGGEAVFAGYGITSEEHGYDDYLGLDVRGKAVMVLRKEPGFGDPDSPFGGTDTTRHAYFATKLENATRRGAAAVVFVNDPASRDRAVAAVADRIAAERRRREATIAQREALPEGASRTRESLAERLRGIESSLAGLENERLAASRGLMGISEAGERPAGERRIPVISLARDTADEVLRRSAGRSLDEIQAEIDATYRPSSFELKGVRVDLGVALRAGDVVSHNVLAVLEGRGELAEETVVIGAHYDHVGMGGYGSLAPGTIAVHNGADDNASGTAMLLAIASRLREALREVDRHRRVLFVAFTAEERGLLGSKRYVRAPRYPLESTVAMLNMDMVGRLRDNELSVYGVGTATGLEALVDRVNETLAFDLHKVATGYGPSDHQSFYEAGVPVLHFFTGLHADYHRPSDKIEKINFGGMFRITDMISQVATDLVTRSDRLVYTETDRRFRMRRQMTAYLGVLLTDGPPGVTIGETVADGPAAAAGLLAGDRLVKLGDRTIRQASDVTEWLRDRTPGDTARVIVERGGRETEIGVVLARRP